MPKKEFKGGTDEFRIAAQGLHGHRAPGKHYNDMDDAEVYKDIDHRRNSLMPTHIDYDEGDQNMTPASPQHDRGRWDDENN